MKRVYQLAAILIVLLIFTAPAFRVEAKERMRVLTNPRVSLNGYSIYNASAKQNDPRAQDPEYIYLVKDSI